MINTLVSYDDQDFNLGNYFAQCNFTLKQRINNPNINFNNLDGGSCTMPSINKAVANYKPNSFVFIAFSHGADDSLHTSSEMYVSQENIENFFRSFFYTSACSCAYKLGPSLIESECHSFIGYYDEIHVHPAYYNDFIDCEIHAIVEFFNTDKSIGESYIAMHKKYDEVIERLLGGSIVDAVVASTLVDNQQLLRILGNQNLTVNDFDHH